MFSGGVGEYVYAREARDFGDLGLRLGDAIRQRLESGRLPFTLLPAGECIRATALGASEYSVQLSGNTIYLSKPAELLPRKNLQVLQPPFKFADAVDPADVASAIREHFQRFDVVEGESELALAFRGVAFEFRYRDAVHRTFWDHGFSYGSAVAAFAQGVMLGAFIQGFRVDGRAFAGSAFDFLTPFSIVTGIALIFGYGLLGAGWLVLKTEGDLREWAYRFTYKSSDERRGWLKPFLHFYNFHRAHSALAYNPPISRLDKNNVLRRNS